MDQTLPKSPLPSRAVLASAGLHALIVTAVGLAGAFHDQLIPKGMPVPVGAVEVALMELPASAPAEATPAPVTLPSPDGLTLTKKKKEVAAPAPESMPQSPASGAAKAATGPAGRSDGVEVAEIDRYLYELRLTLEGRKTYPTLSRRLREAGEVLVEFTVLKDGSIQAVNVVRPSPFARLDEAAQTLVAGLGHFKPLPDSVQRADLTVKLPIRYALN